MQKVYIFVCEWYEVFADQCGEINIPKIVVFTHRSKESGTVFINDRRGDIKKKSFKITSIGETTTHPNATILYQS